MLADGDVRLDGFSGHGSAEGLDEVGPRLDQLQDRPPHQLGRNNANGFQSGALAKDHGTPAIDGEEPDRRGGQHLGEAFAALARTTLSGPAAGQQLDVVEDRQHQARHGQQDHGQGDAPEPQVDAVEHRRPSRHREPERHGEVREGRSEAARGRFPGGAGGRARCRRSQGYQQESGHPSCVEQVAHAKGAECGEVGEHAVRDRYGHEACGDQQGHRATGQWRAREHQQPDRDHRHVAYRITEREHLRQRVLGRARGDRPKNCRPAHEEERGTGDEPIENRAQEQFGTARGGGDGQHPGGCQRHREREADIGDGRKGQLPAEADLEVGPDQLAPRPGQGGGSDQDPGRAGPAQAVAAGDPSRHRRHQRGDRFGEVVHGYRQPRATRLQEEPEDQSQPGGGGDQGQEPKTPRNRDPSHVVRVPHDAGQDGAI